MGDIQWQMFAYIVSQVETPLVSAVAQVVNAFLVFRGCAAQGRAGALRRHDGILIMRGRGGRGWLGAARPLSSHGSGRLGTDRFWDISAVHPRLLLHSASDGLSADALTSRAVQVPSMPIASIRSGSKHGVQAWRCGARWVGRTSPRSYRRCCFSGSSAIVSTVFAFAIWLVSRVLLALYIALGPLLIGPGPVPGDPLDLRALDRLADLLRHPAGHHGRAALHRPDRRAAGGRQGGLDGLGRPDGHDPGAAGRCDLLCGRRLRRLAAAGRRLVAGRRPAFPLGRPCTRVHSASSARPAATRSMPRATATVSAAAALPGRCTSLVSRQPAAAPPPAAGRSTSASGRRRAARSPTGRPRPTLTNGLVASPTLPPERP